MNVVNTVDPRDGRRRATDLNETDESRLEVVAGQASRAAQWLSGLGRIGRAEMLDRVAESLESRRADLVAVAEAETGLSQARLETELTRSALQFRMFGDVLRDGGYVEAAIDHAADTPIGPGPDLRRMLMPLGPVAVFGASNFPSPSRLPEATPPPRSPRVVPRS